MRRYRPRRRSVYFSVTAMHDGTVLTAVPIRKPAGRIMKRRCQKPDADNVCDERRGSYVESFPIDDPGRLRFFDIMANRLNTRRAIRELVLTRLDEMDRRIEAIQKQVEQIAQQVQHVRAGAGGGADR